VGRRDSLGGGLDFDWSVPCLSSRKVTVIRPITSRHAVTLPVSPELLPDPAGVHPTHLPPRIPLDRWTYENYREPPPPMRGGEAGDFWDRHPPLTAGQAVLRRTPASRGLFSHHAAVVVAQRLSRGSPNVIPLGRHVPARLWARSHETSVFRLLPARMRRGISADNPLLQVASWIREHEELESRFLMAAMSPELGYQVRKERIDLYLRRGAEAGYVVDLRTERLPLAIYAPSPGVLQRLSLAPHRLRLSSPEHHALAFEIALAHLQRTFCHCLPSRVLIEPTLMSEALRLDRRRPRGRRPRIGHRTATPDLEVRFDHPEYGTLRFELLSEGYRDRDILAKWTSLGANTLYGATSRTVASRALRRVPQMTCYYLG